MYINSENQIDATEVRALWNSFSINMGVYFIGHQSHWNSLINWKESKKGFLYKYVCRKPKYGYMLTFIKTNVKMFSFFTLISSTFKTSYILSKTEVIMYRHLCTCMAEYVIKAKKYIYS